MRPIVIRAGNRCAERAGILRRDVDGSWKNQLEVDAFAGIVLKAVFHVIAALLPAHNFVAALIRLRIVENLVRDRFFETCVGDRIFHRREIVLELGVKIFAIADPLG